MNSEAFEKLWLVRLTFLKLNFHFEDFTLSQKQQNLIRNIHNHAQKRQESFIFQLTL